MTSTLSDCVGGNKRRDQPPATKHKIWYELFSHKFVLLDLPQHQHQKDCKKKWHLGPSNVFFHWVISPDFGNFRLDLGCVVYIYHNNLRAMALALGSLTLGRILRLPVFEFSTSLASSLLHKYENIHDPPSHLLWVWGDDKRSRSRTVVPFSSCVTWNGFNPFPFHELQTSSTLVFD